MRENSTSPGAKCPDTQSITRLASASFPGNTRWRITTPRFSRPFSSYAQGPVWRNISRTAAWAASG